tara:strand:- start:941 stop:1966 length:1026 start_codon:yes stop_codon:yes gene_type:complete
MAKYQKKEKFNPRKAFYWPDEASSLTVQHIKKTAEDDDARKGISLGIEGVDEYVTPLMPGQVMSIVARPQNYKSGLLEWVAMQAGRRVGAQSAGKEKKGFTEAIMFVSTENLLEDIVVGDIARITSQDPAKLANGEVANMGAVVEAAMQLATIPIFRVCNAIRAVDRYQPLHLTNIHHVMQYMVKQGIDIRGIVLDYLQALPLDTAHRSTGAMHQRRLQVRDDIYRLRDMASEFTCPIWVGVQAKRDLNFVKDWYVADMRDAEETSAIEQRSNRMINLWLPKTRVPPGTQIEPPHGRVAINVAENTIVLKVTKQQGRLPSGKTFVGEIEYTTGEIFNVREM